LEGGRSIAVLILNLCTRAGGWSTPHPRLFIPGKESQYQFYWRLGGPQGQFRWVWKITSQLGFDPGLSSPS